ncbi:MAG TPA: GNAT family protein [Roseomonas sp.]
MAPRISLGLRRATTADIPFIMAVERIHGHDAFINRQSEDEHAAALSSPAFAYFLAIPGDGAPAGFAILSELADPHGNHCLKRIAVAEPGRGLGTPFFNAVTDWAFENTGVHRFWLHTLSTNARARHVYASQGFTEEGHLREARPRPDGSRDSLVIMSMLRPEWQARLAARGSMYEDKQGRRLA